MGYIPLVHHTTEEVHKYGYNADDGKDGSWARSFFRRRRAATGCWREDLEEIGTLVWVDAGVRRNGASGHRILIAVERYGCRLAAATLRSLRLLIVVIIVVVVTAPGWLCVAL